MVDTKCTIAENGQIYYFSGGKRIKNSIGEPYVKKHKIKCSKSKPKKAAPKVKSPAKAAPKLKLKSPTKAAAPKPKLKSPAKAAAPKPKQKSPAKAMPKQKSIFPKWLDDLKLINKKSPEKKAPPKPPKPIMQYVLAAGKAPSPYDAVAHRPQAQVSMHTLFNRVKELVKKWTITVPSHTILYHGRYDNINFKKVNEGIWLSPDPRESLRTMLWKTDQSQNFRLYAIRVEQDIPNVLKWKNQDDFEDFRAAILKMFKQEDFDYYVPVQFGYSINLPHGYLLKDNVQTAQWFGTGDYRLAITMCAIGFNGWRVKWDQDQFMFCNPSRYLKVVSEYRPTDIRTNIRKHADAYTIYIKTINTKEALYDRIIDGNIIFNPPIDQIVASYANRRSFPSRPPHKKVHKKKLPTDDDIYDIIGLDELW